MSCADSARTLSTLSDFYPSETNLIRDVRITRGHRNFKSKGLKMIDIEKLIDRLRSSDK